VGMFNVELNIETDRSAITQTFVTYLEGSWFKSRTKLRCWVISTSAS